MPDLAASPAVRTHTRLVEVDGMRLNVATTEGEPDRPPLVLFNGIGANLELLDGFVEALDPRIPTIRFDAPGIGSSPKRLLPYRFSGLARKIGKLCDQLGHRGPFDVFGISWGGAAAQAFVHEHGPRARRLILAATSMGAAMVPAGPMVWLRIASPARYWSPDYLLHVAPSLYGGDLRTNPEMLRALTRRIHGTTLLGYFQQLWAGVAWTSLPWIWRLPQPVLLMAGSDDPLVPYVNARIMAKLIPHCRLVTYDCGHLFLLTRLAQAAQEVNGFLLDQGADQV